MKFKKILLPVVALSLLVSLAACGSSGDNSTSKRPATTVTSVKTTKDKVTTKGNTTTKNNTTTKKNDPNGIDFSGVEQTRDALVAKAKEAVGNLYQEAKKVLPADKLDAIEIIYEKALVYIDNAKGEVNAVEEYLNAAYKEIKSGIEALKKVANTLEEAKAQALTELELAYNAIKEVVNEETLSYVKSIYDKAKDSLANMTDIDTVKEMVKNTEGELLIYAKNVISDELADIIKEAKANLETLYNDVISKIDDNSIKEQIELAYVDAHNYISSIYKIEDVNAAISNFVSEFKSVVYDIARDAIELEIDEIKEIAKNKILEFKTTALAKLPNEELAKKVDFALTELIENAFDVIDGVGDIDDPEGVINEKVDEVKNAIVEKLNSVLAEALSAIKEEAITKLNDLVNDALDLVEDVELKTDLSDLLSVEIAKINAINTIDTADDTIKEVLEETASGIADILKEYAKVQLDALKDALEEEVLGLVNDALDKISDEELKDELIEFYDTEMELVDDVESLDEIDDVSSKIKEDIKDEIKKILGLELSKLKEKALDALDDLVEEGLNKIEDKDIQSELNSFYLTEKEKINNITDLDSAKDTISNITKETTEEIESLVKKYLASKLDEIKEKAKDELDSIVETGLNKLPDGDLKESLNSYYQEEIKKIEAIDSVDDIDDVLASIYDETTLYIKSLIASTLEEAREKIAAYISSLENAITITPMSFIPEAMRPTYAANLIDGAYDYDFSEFVNISSINYGGFGEQWNMVVENLQDASAFTSIFGSASNYIGLAMSAAKEFYASDYCDDLKFVKESDNYSVTFNLTETEFLVDLELLTKITIPMLGEFNPKLIMSIDVESGETKIFIEISSENMMRYSLTEDSITIAMTYGATKGSRTSYISVEKDDSDNITGHIYEYFTAVGKSLTNSCADFYITDTYTSVVGNKADGMTGFTGFINELYKTNEGKLLGYEIREELTFVGITGTYNTLWFNLNDISGITNIKIGEKTDANDSDKSTCDVYLNNSDTLFAPTYNKKTIVKTSRKYDIEFRTRYFYTLNSETGEYEKIAVEIPMMFIQEDNDKDTNFTDYPTNVLDDNGITSEVIIDQDDLKKILDDYDSLIDVFIENKELIDDEYIMSYVKGNK